MMKKSFSLLITALMLLTAVFMTGCETDPKTLEDYLADSPETRQQIRDAVAVVENKDMTADVSYEANKIIVKCKFKTKYKGKVLEKMSKSYRKSTRKMAEPVQDAIEWIEAETGFSGVTVDVIVKNGNGKRIVKETYPLQEKLPDDTADNPDDTAGNKAADTAKNQWGDRGAAKRS